MKVWLAVIGFTLIMFTIGCEPYGSVIFDNQTTFPIQADIQSVPLDYQGTPEFYYLPGDYIKPGESKEYGTHARRGRSVGIRSKYPVAAVNDIGDIIFYRVFTWDELNDIDWTIVITTSEKGSGGTDNITGK